MAEQLEILSEYVKKEMRQGYTGNRAVYYSEVEPFFSRELAQFMKDYVARHPRTVLKQSGNGRTHVDYIISHITKKNR